MAGYVEAEGDNEEKKERRKRLEAKRRHAESTSFDELQIVGDLKLGDGPALGVHQNDVADTTIITTSG